MNGYVSSIDDDAQTLPTGTITYGSNQSTPQYHGIHVTELRVVNIMGGQEKQTFITWQLPTLGQVDNQWVR